MSATSQRDLHPDAEVLSAFAEQALGQQERDHVLEHLAGCGRCRAVVALASEAAEPELVLEVAAAAVAAPAPRHTHQPVPRWRSWRFAWIPVAAVAATASFAVYVHIARIERGTKFAVNTPPAVPSRETAARPEPHDSKALPQPQAAVSPAPPALPRSSTTKEKTTTAPRHAGGAGGAATSSAPLQFAEAAPPQGAAESLEVSADEAMTETLQSPKASNAPAANQALTIAPQTTANFQERQKEMTQRQQTVEAKKAEADRITVENRMFAASGTPAQAAPSTRNATASQSVTSAAVYDRAAAAPSARLESFGALKAPAAAAPLAGAAKTIHLPSGLSMRSITSASGRMLAIDTEGSLFLSTDSGASWRRVASQWTGRARVVRNATLTSGTSGTAPATDEPTASPSVGSVNGNLSQRESSFEIVNDKNQVWWSADGLIWIAR